MSQETTVSRNEARELLYRLSPLHYIRSLGFSPYQWQEDILTSSAKRKAINGARQAGKSTIVSSKPCHAAKYYPGSWSIILAPTEQQAFYDMEKIKGFIAHDPGYPEILRNSDRLLVLGNGSWISVIPATETSARGPSAPRLILIDEASRVEDIVYTSGVTAMTTNNPDCEMVLISTPHGREGFFFRAMNNPRWERYEVKSPWNVIDIEFRLESGEPEKTYRKRLEQRGIRGYHSPRHQNRDEQEMNLGEMGPLMYRQEYSVEFVEPDDQVFGYDEIERLRRSTGEALDLTEIGEGESLTL
jgi:hypothetical protein